MCFHLDKWLRVKMTRVKSDHIVLGIVRYHEEEMLAPGSFSFCGTFNYHVDKNVQWWVELREFRRGKMKEIFRNVGVRTKREEKNRDAKYHWEELGLVFVLIIPSEWVRVCVCVWKKERTSRHTEAAVTCLSSIYQRSCTWLKHVCKKQLTAAPLTHTPETTWSHSVFSIRSCPNADVSTISCAVRKTCWWERDTKRFTVFVKEVLVSDDVTLFRLTLSSVLQHLFLMKRQWGADASNPVTSIF